MYIHEFRFGPKGGAVAGFMPRAGCGDAAGQMSHATMERQPCTVNHRLTVLSRFFGHLLERDNAVGQGAWLGRSNPVPERRHGGPRYAGLTGRDAPRRGRRAEMRLREPHRLPRAIEPQIAAALIEGARSWRDKALLTLLWRTGQRIGDWEDDDGAGHGVLGMRLGDLRRAEEMVVVRLKGARDEHQVPVTPDFLAAV